MTTVVSTQRLLIPLVLVPRDGAGWNPAHVSGLDGAIAEALAWWEAQLGARAFFTMAARAIGAQQDRAYYTAQPNTQELVRQELALYWPELRGTEQDGQVIVCYAELGADPYQCSGDVIGTSVVDQQGTSWSPPELIVQSSGSLEAFVTGQNPDDSLSGSRAAQVGALAHELGHALSLPHPTDEATQAVSIMYAWWNFPDIALGEAERAQALAYTTGWSEQG